MNADETDVAHRRAQAWRRQSAFTDPGRYADLLDPLVGEAAGREPRAVVDAVSEHVRGLVSHYVASGIRFDAERRAELDSRWVEDILAAIVARDPAPLTVPREPSERFVGCCRDFTALTVAALRHLGVPARSRVGFADYLTEGFWHDHVVVEYWDDGGGAAPGRWVRVDAQLPAELGGIDMRDLDASGPRFWGAAEVWLDFRAGRIDEEEILDYGASPELPMAGAYFVRNYVLLELAHLAGFETLLWDTWGAMATRPLRSSDDHGLVDRVAEVLLDRYVALDVLQDLLAEPGLDPRPGAMISISPSGAFRQAVSFAR